MKIWELLHDRIMSLLLHLFSMLAFSAFLLLTGTSWGVVLIILIVWAIGLCAVTAAAYFRQRNYILELKSIMDGLNQKYLFMECTPKPRDYFERKIFELFRCTESL